METKIEVYTKNVYGNSLIYPHNEQAKQFAALIGHKTLSRHELSRIESMGFEVVNLSFVGSQF
jgi:hypothetical protein